MAAPENFKNLLDQEIEPDSRIYASPWIGDDKMHSLVYHDNTDKVIFSQTEMVGLEKYFEGNQSVDVIPYTVRDYALDLNTTNAGVDYEFVAPPGRRIGPRSGGGQVTPYSIDSILKDWTSISDRLVRGFDAATYYLDTIWADEKGSPRSPELSLEDIHLSEEEALSKYFDSTELLEGDDYSLLRATR